MKKQEVLSILIGRLSMLESDIETFGECAEDTGRVKELKYAISLLED